jgi:ferredoxin-NADP reductase
MALEVIHTLTRTQPPGWTGYSRRIDAELLREVAWPVEQHPLAYICGPTPFVETAAAALLPLGYEPTRIKTERFGPTGGS